MMPLDYLLSIMRDQTEDKRVRLDAAKAAAPHSHARLSSTETTGPDKEPIKHQVEITNEMRARALLAFLAKFPRAGQETANLSKVVA